jgi:enamine deaminase RidA (YjgF/YER057c/UK114 family)
MIKRTAFNPWDWSLKYGFKQAEMIEGASRHLICAGQTAIDAEGNPQHAGDIRAQLTLSLDNLEAVLKGAGMDLSNVVRLSIYTTDVDKLIENWDAFAERMGAANNMPPQTLVGVARLAFPDLMVELEATAAA